jgi:hypothetical protein
MKNAPRKFQIKTFKKQLEAPTNEAQRKMRLTLLAEEEAETRPLGPTLRLGSSRTTPSGA